MRAPQDTLLPGLSPDSNPPTNLVAIVGAGAAGLATAIFTQDISRANRLATKIHVGLCWINSWFLRDLRTPFGGSKQSGIGREGGLHSLEFYTELRNVMIKY